MASHLKTVSRTVITRRPADIDPKVAGVFAVAAATIGLVVALVAVTILLGGKVDLAAVIGPVLPVLIAAAVGYLKHSAHAELVEDGVETADDLVDAIAPVLEQLAPELAPAIEQVHDGVEQIHTALTAP